MTTAGQGPIRRACAAVAHLLGQQGGTVTDPLDLDDLVADDELADDEFRAKIHWAKAPSRGPDEPETTLQRRIVATLNARPGHQFRKLHIGPEDQKGQPDLYGCVTLPTGLGRMVVIEVKSWGPGYEPRPQPAQDAALLEWQRAGALVGWATSMRQVDQILACLDDPAYRYAAGGGPGAPAPGTLRSPEDP